MRGETRMPIIIPKDVEETCKKLIEAGFQAYLVGGAVRDSLLNLQPTDWDIATDALPEDVENLFAKTIPTGRQFGTITVVLENRSLEVTTMRRDGPYSDGRRPDRVEYTHRLESDLGRRDFTINAIALHPVERRFIDPYRGRRDLIKKRLQTVGSASRRFEEDPLRMLRLVRFQSVLGFKSTRKTELALKARLIARVSPERILTELNKMLLGQWVGPALEFFYRSGLMEEILPELAETASLPAGESHPFNLLGHSLMSASFAAPQLPLRWAALLHDLGKKNTLKREHALIGSEMAATILRRLRASNELINTVRVLVAEHMFEVHPHSSAAAIRRFIAKVGTPIAFDLIKLRQADLAGLNKDPRQILAYGEAMNARINEIIAQENALTLADLAVDGQVLMDKLGLKPGPQVGQILNYLLEIVWSDPDLNEPERLLQAARNYLKSLP